MRCVAGVGLLLLGGCNQIFGIAATQPWDAPPDVVPDMPHVVLTWQLATTAPSGAPSPALEYPPFAAGAGPQIRIATLEGPFMPAAYSSSPGKEGWIEIPRSYFDTDGAGSHPTWRLEYTLVGGAPHEVQWAPDDKIAHLVVPMVGRLDRQSAPLGGGYRVTPSGYAGPYTFPQLFTTGLWTAGVVDPPTPPSTSVTVDYDFSSKNAPSLSGAHGRLDATRGDRGFLVDFIFDPTTRSDATLVECRVAAGSAALTDVALEPGAHTAQTPTWDAARLPVMADAVNLAALDQLTTGLGKLHGTFQGTLSWLLFGSVPSTDFPGLTGVSSLDRIRLPIPVMQVLFQCPFDAPRRPSTAQPLLLRDFPSVLHAQLVDSRKVLGADLLSGIEAVVTSSGAGFKLEFPAAMPTQITLTTPGAGVLDLVDNTEQVAAGVPTGPFNLEFVPQAGADRRADYHDVILHRIVAGELTSERVFTVTAPRVRIDGALLARNADYVFEIRSYKGHIAAPLGDFAPVDYPYGAAIVFTRTFHTS